MTRTVYIVDNSSRARAACSFLLRGHGYQTRVFDGGPEFLESNPGEGCVVLKMHMPGMNGLQIHADMIAQGINLPVIILDGDVPQAVRAMQQGIVDFIPLPYDPVALVRAVERAFVLADDDEGRRQIKAAALERLVGLNARGVQLLQGVHAGMGNATMARWLDLSQRTVEAYRATMMAEIGATSVSQAVRIAIDGDLAPIDDRGAAMIASD
jgi:two-component system response regulator FixJ